LTAATLSDALENTYQTELRLLRAHSLNVLLEGTAAATDNMLHLVRPHIRAPLVWHPRQAPLELPTSETAGLILRDVSALTDDEQTRLLLWLGGPGARTHVVSTTEYSLFTLVMHGLFDAALYYRLNVLLLRIGPSRVQSDAHFVRADAGRAARRPAPSALGELLSGDEREG